MRRSRSSFLLHLPCSSDSPLLPRGLESLKMKKKGIECFLKTSPHGKSFSSSRQIVIPNMEAKSTDGGEEKRNSGPITLFNQSLNTV